MEHLPTPTHYLSAVTCLKPLRHALSPSPCLSCLPARAIRRPLSTISTISNLHFQDLRILRDISQHLIHFDAVTFLTYLESLRQSEGKSSVWLFHDATHTIYEQV